MEAIFKSNSRAVNSNLLTVLYKWCSPSMITTMNSEQLVIFQMMLGQYVAMNPNFHTVDSNTNNSNSNNTNNKNPSTFKRDFQKTGVGMGPDTSKSTSTTNSFGFAKQLSSRKRLCVGSNNIFDSANNDFI